MILVIVYFPSSNSIEAFDSASVFYGHGTLNFLFVNILMTRLYHRSNFLKVL